MKGYGFIEGSDGKDYFLHHSQVPEGIVLKEEDEVEFTTIETDKGTQAQNMKKLGD